VEGERSGKRAEKFGQGGLHGIVRRPSAEGATQMAALLAASQSGLDSWLGA